MKIFSSATISKNWRRWRYLRQRNQWEMKLGVDRMLSHGGKTSRPSMNRCTPTKPSKSRNSQAVVKWSTANGSTRNATLTVIRKHAKRDRSPNDSHNNPKWTTFSPVSGYKSFRTVLTIVIASDGELHQMDLKNCSITICMRTICLL